MVLGQGPLAAVVSGRRNGAADSFGGVFSGRRIFITGHTGFKGSWLTWWLLRLGADITGYALEPDTTPALFDLLDLRSRITHHAADICDLERLRAAISQTQPDVVLHLAAQPLVRRSYAEPVATFQTNVMGSVNVLEAVREVACVRAIVNVTSDKCYENREWEFAYRENDALGGFDPYSASKGAAEIVTAAYRRSFFSESGSAAVASARAGNVIGGGDWAEDRIIPDCIRSLTAGQAIAVRNPGAVRPWQHVLEPLSGYLQLAAALLDDGSLASAWNFGPVAGGNLTVRQVVEAVLDTWGGGEWTGPREGETHPHEARFLKLDCAKATDVLGWSPVWDAQRAIRETTLWYRDLGSGSTAIDLTDACIDRYEAEAGDSVTAG